MKQNTQWEQAWLAYQPLDHYADYAYLTSVVCDKQDEITESAIREIRIAAKSLFHCQTTKRSEQGRTKHGIALIHTGEDNTGEEGYCIRSRDGWIYISSEGSKGLLYGTFHVLRLAAAGVRIAGLSCTEKPYQPLRMLDHWDNFDGSIERGYAGNSFFFVKNRLVVNKRTRDYARMLASVGINGMIINNTNVKEEAIWLLTEKYAEPMRKLTELFAAYGIQIYISADFAAPIEIGQMTTADPENKQVKSWWKKQTKKLYEAVPLLGGYLVKADSEGRPGPFTYNRTHAQGANTLADALQPYGGRLIWRCFVYNCQQDWRDKKTDRARAAYDVFTPLDGQFHENVILQIKNGPMDFQVREPVHPLFGKMPSTNQMIEFEITQEYTGQQRHVCYLIPMWREILHFHTCCGKADQVMEIVSGRNGGKTGTANCGMAGIANVGDDANWTGHDLAGANLYGYGRLAWNPDLSSEEIAEEWIRLALTRKQSAVEKILQILMGSWPAYEQYTAPLGVGWMVNPSYHYGPNVNGYEYDRWGTYHRADHLGIGIDRTRKGTGYASLYQGENRTKYEDVQQCPDELLLFFHHVPYTHVLHSGETVLQHIYNTHFAGVEQVDKMCMLWKQVKPYIREQIYDRTAQRFLEQKTHSREWRDQINTYFYRMTLIPDQQGRKIY